MFGVWLSVLLDFVSLIEFIPLIVQRFSQMRRLPQVYLDWLENFVVYLEMISRDMEIHP